MYCFLFNNNSCLLLTFVVYFNYCIPFTIQVFFAKLDIFSCFTVKSNILGKIIVCN